MCICLFTYSTIRAIHLEIVTELTLDACLQKNFYLEFPTQIMMPDSTSTYLLAMEELKDSQFKGIRNIHW